MSFQKIVLTIALVILIIVLIVVAYLIQSAKSDAAFPPETPSCPDYFEAVADGNGGFTEKCTNTQGLGNGAPGVTNFGMGAMTCPKNQPCTKTALAARCNWAKQHGLTWDGVTNRSERIKNPAGSGTIVRPIC
jgi:hypothetical protein